MIYRYELLGTLFFIYIQRVNITTLDKALSNADFIVVTCALNKHTYHLVRSENILKCNKGVKIINVARGPVVCENDVCDLLNKKFISSVGFDVFEVEPLPKSSKLRNYTQNFFGSHNGSNTIEGVDRTSEIAIKKIFKFLNNIN